MLFQILQMVLPFICMGDEATDIWYVIENWEDFANQALRVSAVAFIVIPFCIIIFIVPWFMHIQQIQNFHFQNLGCDFGCWKYPIFIFTTWTKLIIYFKKCYEFNDKQPALNLFSIQKKRKYIRTMAVIQTFLEWFFEDIPQIIIQTVNNFQTENWDQIEVISVILSLIMLIAAPFLFWYQIKEADSQNRNDGKQIRQISTNQHEKSQAQFKKKMQDNEMKIQRFKKICQLPNQLRQQAMEKHFPEFAGKYKG